MLTYFPTPYPDEWWYSVLCRYHVRSGRKKFATTLHELYGAHPLTHGRLFPGSDCFAVIKQLPNVLSLEAVLLEHTLMPYYLRFHLPEKKKLVFNNLMAGRSGGLTSIQLQTPERKQGLKFCPMCRAEDTETYGEPYWHREHQIPLMPLCPKHGYRLRLVEIPLSKLSEVFLPLSSINAGNDVTPASLPWEPLLSDALNCILSLPFGTGPPLGYSNLESTLLSAGFGIHAVRGKASLDAEKLRVSCTEFYGKSIGDQYFAKLSPAIIYRVCHWKLTSPERYALLIAFAGLTVEELLGTEIPVVDPLLKKLLEYKEKGLACKKEELAQLVGVSPHQLDSLAKKYNIAPFWKQCGGKRTETIRITLTTEEKQNIAQAAAIHGNGQTAVFAREVLLRGVNQILKNDIGGTTK
jgi:hypothetical protein